MKIHEAQSLDENASVTIISNLPRVIRYYDDYHDKMRSISDLDQSDVWHVHADGKEYKLEFQKAPISQRQLLKHVVADLFGRCDPSSVTTYANSLLAHPGHLDKAAKFAVLDFVQFWNENILTAESNADTTALRAALHSLCNLSVGQWNPDLRDVVSSLRSPRNDIYKTVRSRECFVPMDHQSIIIEFLDDLTASLVNNDLRYFDIRNACILLLSHQYGLRPGSIARIKLHDVKIHESSAVHISIPLTKQRERESLRRVTRRIKHDWTPLFAEFIRQRKEWQSSSEAPADSLFLLAPASVTQVIQQVTEELLGEVWNPTDFRHTAAQRLADAGASHISLSEFLGHSTTLTANVYFDASPSQAERINQALSISPIYTEIADIAKTKTITPRELRDLPPANQIGAVPHGIPISGIGGCTIGQSLCAKNPVLSCYTCRRFMPVADRRVHENVVESLRPVVKMFADTSHNSSGSGSHAQLTRTLRAAMQVIDGIKPEGVAFEGGTDE